MDVAGIGFGGRLQFTSKPLPCRPFSGYVRCCSLESDEEGEEMRKTIVVIGAMVLALSLTGCSDKASELDGKIESVGEVTADSWDVLSKLSNEYWLLDDSSRSRVERYSDLQADIEQCSLMKNDQAFLDALEKSILQRMEKKDDPDRAMLVNAELAMLDQYRGTDFYDQGIARACEDYLNGLDMQKEALGQEYNSDLQIEWQRGRVMRGEVLKTLYETRGFLSSNSEFVASYVSAQDEQSNLLNAYEAIEADIGSQVDRIAVEEEWTEYSVSFEVDNNTDYQFDSMWECSLKNEAGTVTEGSSCYVENVKPHSRYTVTFYFSNSESGYGGFDWNNYYANVKA